MEGTSEECSEDSRSSVDIADDNDETQTEHHFKEILQSLPSNITGEAKDLLHMMANSKDIISWDSSGQIKFHQRSIPKSQLSHLLEYVLLPEDDDIEQPVGLNAFMKGLAELGIDKALIRNHAVLGKVVALEKESGENSENQDDESINASDTEDVSDSEISEPSSDQEDEEDIEDENSDSESTNTNDDNTEDPWDCPECGNSDINETFLRKCPDCHWTDDHNKSTPESLSCKACGCHLLESSFPVSKVVHHCTNCDHVSVLEHDEDQEHAE